MTTIGPSLHITGEITSQEDVAVHGRINGQIRMQEGSLLVATKGHVDAEVEGSRVTIHGTLAGNVVASERIELTATADVTGTLTTISVVLHDGATFNGMIDMERPSKKAKAPVKTGAAPADQVAKTSERA